MHEKGYAPPGMLFQGSRGTGKTTMARIFAASVNCTGLTYPCKECNSCKAVIRRTSPSVIEIDAASHGLIADVRDIEDRCQYGHGGKWRVWIIDEAHGLSRAANDALLKILEEPPPETTFILVTTEPDKIIETVKSRTMIFEFRRLKVHDIATRLLHVCKEEEIGAEAGALVGISEYVEGGMRNAVMILEQLSYYKNPITYDDFKEFFGVIGREGFDELMLTLVRRNYQRGVELIEEFFRRSSEGRYFLKCWSKYLLDLLLYKEGVDTIVTENVVNRVDKTDLLKAIDIIWEALIQVRYSTDLQNDIPRLIYAKMVGVFKVLDSDTVVMEDETLEVLREYTQS
jgi:DNA polymerase-3 subunit gamma/tau